MSAPAIVAAAAGYVAGVDDRLEDLVPVKIDLNKLDPQDICLRLTALPQALALLGTVDENEVHSTIQGHFKVPAGCSLKISNLRKGVVKAFGGQALSRLLHSRERIHAQSFRRPVSGGISSTLPPCASCCC